VSGRVVIDSDAYFRFNPGHSFSPSRQNNGDDAVDSVCFEDGEINSDIENDAMQKAPDDVSLDENQLLICRPIVRGYALKLKKWRRSTLHNFTTILTRFKRILKLMESRRFNGTQKFLVTLPSLKI
jgi:hypothetical protein